MLCVLLTQNHDGLDWHLISQEEVETIKEKGFSEHHVGLIMRHPIDGREKVVHDLIYALDDSSIEVMLCRLVTFGYLLGFNHGKDGLPLNVKVDPEGESFTDDRGLRGDSIFDGKS